MICKPLVSLCMPTNGVVEWVFPVLESIYKQNVNCNLFEVVITDNGDNQDFKEKIKEYLKDHSNLFYAETKALPFINEIESYKRASGELIKFVNHRTLLVDGALQRLLDVVQNNRRDKPIIYFTNGALKTDESIYSSPSFNDFVRNLSYWSSCSTGMAIWKSDFEKLPEDVSCFNELFPHTNVLFNERNRGRYVIDNSVIFDEMPQGKRPKGHYDLYGAFGIEYPSIIEKLLMDGSISQETYEYVINQNLGFIASLYWGYNIRKHYCSYDLSGLDNMYGVFYTKGQLMRKVVKHVCAQAVKKIVRRG